MRAHHEMFLEFTFHEERIVIHFVTTKTKKLYSLRHLLSM